MDQAGRVIQYAMPPAGDAGKPPILLVANPSSSPVGLRIDGETGSNVRFSSRVDDEFYQGIFNFQITIIDFIIRKYAAKRYE